MANLKTYDILLKMTRTLLMRHGSLSSVNLQVLLKIDARGSSQLMKDICRKYKDVKKDLDGRIYIQK